jgi:predicted TIM-barrel fold metal-dependent hydrolase
MSERTHFPSHFALAETPWFRLVDGHRLVLDADVGPICDVHTHLALSFAGPPRLDLRARHERTRHYLPLENALDLEVYINRNFKPADLVRMKRDLTVLGVTPWGMRTTHTAENLCAEMRDLGIVASVLLPIDFQRFSYNAEAYLAIADEYAALTSLGSVHPYGDRIAEKLDAQVAAGARGVKVHPAVQLVRPDHPKCMALYRLCAERSLPILWHCGPVDIEPRLGRYLSQLKHYWRAVAENPGTTFILGHSGALQFDAGLELAQRYENVWLEVSSQSLTNVRRALTEGPPDRVMFGTDWPFYHQATQLAKVLMATESDPGTRSRVLWENAARLFDLEAPAG